MSNIYETTIIVKPDLANDQLKSLNTSIDHFFSDNNVTIGYREDWGIKNLKTSITQNLDYFKDLSPEEIANERKNKFLKIGRSDGFISTNEDFSSLTIKKNKFENILKSKKIQIGIGIGVILLGLIFLLI